MPGLVGPVRRPRDVERPRDPPRFERRRPGPGLQLGRDVLGIPLERQRSDLPVPLARPGDEPALGSGGRHRCQAPRTARRHRHVVDDQPERQAEATGASADQGEPSPSCAGARRPPACAAPAARSKVRRGRSDGRVRRPPIRVSRRRPHARGGSRARRRCGRRPTISGAARRQDPTPGARHCSAPSEARSGSRRPLGRRGVAGEPHDMRERHGCAEDKRWGLTF